MSEFEMDYDRIREQFGRVTDELKAERDHYKALAEKYRGALEDVWNIADCINEDVIKDKIEKALEGEGTAHYQTHRRGEV